MSDDLSLTPKFRAAALAAVPCIPKITSDFAQHTINGSLSVIKGYAELIATADGAQDHPDILKSAKIIDKMADAMRRELFLVLGIQDRS